MQNLLPSSKTRSKLTQTEPGFIAAAGPIHDQGNKMGNHPMPKISASIRIDPETHSFTKSQAPNLNLTITSHHADAITIYADDLSPKLMITCGALKIIDLANGTDIRQSVRTHCRIPPPIKIPMSLNESLFHTLMPNIPLTLSAPFTRSRTSTGEKPLSKHDPAYSGDGSARHGACGVDGLEPGHRYALSPASQPRVIWNIIRWWEYGTKEHVLRWKDDGGGLDGRQVKWGPGPHQAIVVDIANIGVVVFECCE